MEDTISLVEAKKRLREYAEENNEANNKIAPIQEIFHHKTLEERAVEYDGKLMLDGEYDWGDTIER